MIHVGENLIFLKYKVANRVPRLNRSSGRVAITKTKAWLLETTSNHKPSTLFPRTKDAQKA